MLVAGVALPVATALVDNAPSRGDTRVFASALAGHEPILILGDEGLVGLPGAGTSDDPFVIEGYLIDAAGNDTGIWIANTTRSLEIRNCGITGALLYGIFLDNCSHVTITNCSFTNCYDGIYIEDGRVIVVAGNVFANNEDGGIYCQYIDGSVIANNEIQSSYYGIYLGYAGSSSGNIVEGNRISNASGCVGIQLFVGGNNTIIENEISGVQTAVDNQHSHNNTFIKNLFSHNLYYAISFYTVNDTKLYQNVFINSSLGHVLINQDWNTTRWDNGSRGNYWDDYSARYPNATTNGLVWDTPYSLVGTADNFPLAYNPLTQPTAPVLSMRTSSPTNSTVIQLNWSSTMPAIFYTLYRGTTAINASTILEAIVVNTTSGTVFNDTVPGEGTYWYAVVVTTEWGSSQPSNTEYVVVDTEEPPVDDPLLFFLLVLAVSSCSVAVIVVAFILVRRHVA